MSSIGTTYADPALGAKAIERDARVLLGHVMEFVAVTFGFVALGAYLGRGLSGATALALFIVASACVGVHVVATGGHEQLAIGIRSDLVLLLGPRSPSHRRLRRGRPVGSALRSAPRPGPLARTEPDSQARVATRQ